jgi:drug/metabolite transporter (DMT)-like permease
VAQFKPQSPPHRNSARRNFLLRARPLAGDNHGVNKPLLDARSLAHLNLVIATLCWGSSWVVARGLRDMIPPVALSFWRWVIACAVILPFAWPYLRRDAPVLRANWKLLFFLGCTGTTGFSTLGYWGVNHTTATNASLLNGAMPALIIGLGALLDRAWPSRRVAAGLVLAICGTVYMVAQGSWGTLAGLEFNRGDALVLAGMIGWAVYTCTLRWRPAGLHSLSFFAVTATSGTLALVPLYLWESGVRPMTQLNAPIIGGILYLAFACSLLAYCCWNAAVAVVGSQTAGLFNNLVPLFGVAMAVLFLGETPHAYHFIGALLVFMGVALVSRR